jgi:hypothetical protein
LEEHRASCRVFEPSHRSRRNPEQQTKRARTSTSAFGLFLHLSTPDNISWLCWPEVATKRAGPTSALSRTPCGIWFVQELQAHVLLVRFLPLPSLANSADNLIRSSVATERLRTNDDPPLHLHLSASDKWDSAKCRLRQILPGHGFKFAWFVERVAEVHSWLWTKDGNLSGQLAVCSELDITRVSTYLRPAVSLLARLDQLGPRRLMSYDLINNFSSQCPLFGEARADTAAKSDDWLCALISIVQWVRCILSDPKITPNAASGPPASWKLAPACSSKPVPGCLACLHQGIILPQTPHPCRFCCTLFTHQGTTPALRPRRPVS